MPKGLEFRRVLFRSVRSGGRLDREFRLYVPVARVDDVRQQGGRGQGGLPLQRRFQLAVGAHIHHEPSTLDFGVDEIAQVESREAHRRAGTAAYHARKAFGAILHRIAYADQIQVAWETESEVEVRKAVAVGRIPVAAGTNVVDMVAGRSEEHTSELQSLRH